jgi:UDP-N-acetylglucosamine 2-epimerase (non-hydrolysing)
MSKPRVAFVIGTRPDAIKTLPVVLAMQKRAEVETLVISTGQHKEMLEQVLQTFGVQPTLELGLMKHGQGLGEMTGRMHIALDEALAKLEPQFLFAQGDTTTTYAAGLAAFYRHVPFGHIEAGLRTHNISDPFPEEFNRRAVALVAAQHYAPTDLSAQNLIQEGVSPDKIFVTGNTGIDAVLSIAQKLDQTWYPDHQGKVILVTMHRRENWGEPMRRAAKAFVAIAHQHSDLKIVVAMHRNPTVREVFVSELGDHAQIDLIEPPEYAQFTKLVQRADLILTDSGGVQEEAPSFGKPILVLRETTERPEGVHAGCAELVGTDFDLIVARANALLTSEPEYQRMSKVSSPFGDGNASDRIVQKALGLLFPG